MLQSPYCLAQSHPLFSTFLSNNSAHLFFLAGVAPLNTFELPLFSKPLFLLTTYTHSLANKLEARLLTILYLSLATNVGGLCVVYTRVRSRQYSTL
ncbi:hypothetical protein F4774DRAFT_377067 [Daldinia eschscholtzii]|nr:hypothetical protein F4774DRAFT_377067 [Daldinia eschscholtzii]